MKMKITKASCNSEIKLLLLFVVWYWCDSYRPYSSYFFNWLALNVFVWVLYWPGASPTRPNHNVECIVLQSLSYEWCTPNQPALVCSDMNSGDWSAKHLLIVVLYFLSSLFRHFDCLYPRVGCSLLVSSKNSVHVLVMELYAQQGHTCHRHTIERRKHAQICNNLAFNARRSVGCIA